MLSQRTVESFVGVFLLAGIIALLVLAFKVSGLTSFFKTEGYEVTAAFDDIGQLKIRSAVKIGGVTVGEVTGIKLDPQTFKAVVEMHINSKFNDIPTDSSASILTAGLLGDNYIAITPMYNPQFLKNGDAIEETHSAMILEKLIGQLMFKITNSNTKESADKNATTTAAPKGATQ
jgi:phospholipid/cholesterol/gamma-HCH transport system substrate-binding protein